MTEAGLDRELTLSVSTNGPATVRLATSGRVQPVEFPAGDHEVTVTLCGDGEGGGPVSADDQPPVELPVGGGRTTDSTVDDATDL